MSIQFNATPAADEIYEAPNGVNYQWDGEKWSTRTTSRNTSLGGNPGPNPPNGAAAGDFWYNTDTGQLYIFIDMGSGTLSWERTSVPYSANLVELP